MNVRELIAYLKQYPEDTRVILREGAPPEDRGLWREEVDCFFLEKERIVVIALTRARDGSEVS